MTARSVLIVDDDVDLAESFAEYLRLQGHEVETVFTSKAGIDAVHSDPYEFIIVDVGLPDINGVETARTIGRVRPAARVVLMTGHSAAYLKKAQLDVAGVDVLTKPIHPDQLLRLIG